MPLAEMPAWRALPLATSMPAPTAMFTGIPTMAGRSGTMAGSHLPVHVRKETPAAVPEAGAGRRPTAATISNLTRIGSPAPKAVGSMQRPVAAGSAGAENDSGADHRRFTFH